MIQLTPQMRLLVYDGQGFRLCHKRLSSRRFSWWPSSADEPVTALQTHELQVLLHITAAERFFGAKPADLFEHILYKMDMPPPLRRGRAKTRLFQARR